MQRSKKRLVRIKCCLTYPTLKDSSVLFRHAYGNCPANTWNSVRNFYFQCPSVLVVPNSNVPSISSLERRAFWSRTARGHGPRIIRIQSAIDLRWRVDGFISRRIVTFCIKGQETSQIFVSAFKAICQDRVSRSSRDSSDRFNKVPLVSVSDCVELSSGLWLTRCMDLFVIVFVTIPLGLCSFRLQPPFQVKMA